MFEMSKDELTSAAALSIGPGVAAAVASLGEIVLDVDVDARRECAASDIIEADTIRPDRHEEEFWRRPEEKGRGKEV